MTKFPSPLIQLIGQLKKFPGVGAKTAERFAFELLKWREEELKNLSDSIEGLLEKVPACPLCGCLTDGGSCSFCNPSRDPHLLCLLASPRDVYAIEETHSYQGLYHVVENLLSPLDGRRAETIRIERIEKRLEKVTEVILAFDSTLEGDATALYLKRELNREGLTFTRLAFGIPLGSSLDYIDSGTLARSFLGRSHL
jgi:recombination protein RecR